MGIKFWKSHRKQGYWFWDCEFLQQQGYAVVDDFGDLVPVPWPGVLA